MKFNLLIFLRLKEDYLWLKIIFNWFSSVLTEDLLQYWFEVNSDVLHEVVTAVIWLLDVSWLRNAHVEFVHVWGESLIDSLLKLSNILVTSEFPDDWKTDGLNIKNGLVDFLNVMFRNFHPWQSTVASILGWQVGLFETAIKLQIFLVWILWCSFNHH